MSRTKATSVVESSRYTAGTISHRPTVYVTENISAVTRTAVSLEYASLRHHHHCPLGMYVVPSFENLMVWDGAFFVHQGYYADAILKFRLIFPFNYPEGQPSVQFVTDIFHPLIASQTGIFNMSRRFRPWRPKEHHAFDVLHYVKSAFKKQELDQLRETDCLNKEAFRLYHNSTCSFAALATQSSALSKSTSALFDSDHPSMTEKVSSGLNFCELGKNELEECRKKLGMREWQEVSWDGEVGKPQVCEHFI